MSNISPKQSRNLPVETFADALRKIYDETKQDEQSMIGSGNKSPLSNKAYYHILEAYFRNDFRDAMINHHLESYNYFIKYGIAKIIRGYNPIVFLVENKHSDLTETNKKIKFFEHNIEFTDIRIRKPSVSVGCRGRRILYPNECRLRNSIYQADIYATIKHSMRILDNTRQDIKPEGTPKILEINNIKIGAIPVMLHSILCSLYRMSEHDLRRIAREDPNDLGGYFIINGSEKVLVSQEKKISNHVTFYKNPKKTFPYVCEIKCCREDTYGSPSTATVKMDKKDRILFALSPGFAPDVNIPIFIMFKALGIVDDQSILEYIMYDSKDDTMINLLQPSLFQKIQQTDSNESDVIIQTQEQALNYIAERIRVKKPSIFLSRGIGIEDIDQKIEYMLNVFNKHLFPHIKSNNNQKIKAFFLGYMCNKLLLGRRNIIIEDDRDNYALKRIDTAGVLISQLFYQSFSVFLAKTKENIRRESTSKNFKATELEAMIIRAIPESEIESKHKKAFSTGEWSVSRTSGGIAKQGVAQLLQRLTPLNTISALRRVVTPQTANQKAKPEIRRVHATHWGICCVTGDTEVLLDDGITTCPIKDLGAKAVLTVNSKDLTEEPSHNKIFYEVTPKKLYEITTISGRKIKCTPDHPLLIKKDNKMDFTRVDKIDVGDLLVIKPNVVKRIDPSDYTYKIDGNKISDQYRAELNLKGYIGKEINDTTLSIIARLIGALNTDDHVGIRQNKKYMDAEFYVGEKVDAYNIIDDITRLGFASPKFERRKTNFNGCKHKTYRVAKNGAFAVLMIVLGGKKVESEFYVPDWIMNGSKLIKREFLAGFQGGDGGKISIQKEGKTYRMRMIPITQSKRKDKKQALEKFLDQIKVLFAEFDIMVKIHIIFIEKENNYRGLIKFPTHESIIKFGDEIGYRYCNQKQRNSGISLEYLKYLQEFMKDRYKKLMRLHKNGESVKDISNKINIDERQIRRIIAKKGVVKLNTVDTIAAYDFVTKNKLQDNLGKFTIPIKSIVEIEPEIVYDITTISNNHSFIANHIVSSNCAVETPEGPQIGMVKNIAMLTKITTSSSPQFVLELLDKMEDIIPLEKLSASSIKNYTKIFVNGDWLACTGSTKTIVNSLRDYRKKMIIPPSTSIVRDFRTNEIRIYTDAGRCIRPLFIVDSGRKLRIDDDIIRELVDGKLQWDDLIKREFIEYIGVQEAIYNTLISMYPSDLVLPKNRLKRYTHCEVHPLTILGTAASLIPFCQHNQAPRNLFQCAQCKQALSIYALNYRDRIDTMGHVMYYPQKPFVTTCMSKFTKYDDVPAGQNIIVAIMTYTG